MPNLLDMLPDVRDYETAKRLVARLPANGIIALDCFSPSDADHLMAMFERNWPEAPVFVRSLIVGSFEEVQESSRNLPQEEEDHDPNSRFFTHHASGGRRRG